jgi:hypothetical protein
MSNFQLPGFRAKLYETQGKAIIYGLAACATLEIAQKAIFPTISVSSKL